MKILSQVFRRVGRFIEGHPVVCLAIAALLLLVAVQGAASMTSMSGPDAFVRDSGTIAEYESSFDRGTVAVVVEGDPTDPETMQAIDRFDRRAENIEHVETVLSPADTVRRQQGRIPNSQYAISRSIESERTTIIQIILEPDLTQEEKTFVFDETSVAKQWAQFPAGTPVTITGSPVFYSQMMLLIESSTRQLIALAVGFMAITLYLLFRGVRLRLFPIFAVILGVIYTFGAMGYFEIPNSTLTSAVFPILVGLGIDYSVQLHQRYEEELKDAPPSEALPVALAGIGPAVSIAMFAAALGFGATWISARESPAFVWFAQTSIIGIFLTFLTAVLVLLPTLTLYFRWQASNGKTDTHREGVDGISPSENNGTDTDSAGGNRKDARSSPVSVSDEANREHYRDEIGRLGLILGRTARVTATHPGIVIAIAGILLASGFYADDSLGVISDPEEFVPDDLPALLDLQELRSRTGGAADVRYSVLVSGGQQKDPETLRWMEDFETVARSQPQVRAVESPADAVRRYNDGQIPKTASGVENVIERMPPHVRNRYFDDGYAHITVIGDRNMGPRQVTSLDENTESALEMSHVPPGVHAEMTGKDVFAGQLIHDQIRDRNRITAYGLVFVFTLLVVYYRDPVKSIAPLIPMVFIIGWQGLYMSALDIAVSPLGASLGALTVGIGAEYTIIVMERFYEEKANGVSPVEAIEIAAQRVGKAITVSGMTTIFGFSALLLSPFPIVSDFGFLTVGVISMTLVGALLVLPPTLLTLDSLQSDWRRWRGEFSTRDSPA